MKLVKFVPKKEMTFKSVYKHNYFNMLKRSKKDFYFLVGDIEAYIDDNGEFVFSLGVIFDGINSYVYYTLEEYYKGINDYFSILDIKQKQKNIYFHNLDFDIIFFLKELSFGENIKIINSGNMMLSFNDVNFNFRNSLSILPMSLKQVVKVWLKIDFPEWENEKSNVLDLDIETLEHYCIRDCFLLYFAVFKLRDLVLTKYEVDNFLTIPSLTIKVFKKFYNSSTFLENKKNSFFDDGYYYGGHTEKFVNDIYNFEGYGLDYYDVNSLYPFIMRDLEVNVTGFKMLKPSLKNVYSLLYSKEIFYIDCKIEIKHDNFRVIPVKYEQANYYPIGVFDCKISNITLQFLMENNHLFIKEIYGLIKHEENKKEKVFKNFIEVFYKMRKEDKENDLIYKFLLNSLYGKFGQNEEQTSTVLNPNDATTFSNMTVFGDNLLCSKDDKVNYRLDYLRKDIAGMITEKSRIYMAKNRLSCYKRGVKTLYQDTDSLILNREITNDYVLGALVDNKILGKFKRESEETIYDGRILGLKLYYLTDKLSARKGLKNIRKDNYKSIAYALELKSLIKQKYVKFFTEKPAHHNDKIDLTLFPNLLFYNDRFTKPKTFVKKGFFGIQRVPFYISKISEKLDRLPDAYYKENN